jgi:hypothetical protein
VGSYTLTATPYTGGGGWGTPGTPLTLNFSVIDQPSSGAVTRLAETQQPALPDPRQMETLYPNPTWDGRIKVQLAEKIQGKITYWLVNAVGQKLDEGSINLVQPTRLLGFDFSSQIHTIGVYYLRLEGENLKAVLKIMRE